MGFDDSFLPPNWMTDFARRQQELMDLALGKQFWRDFEQSQMNFAEGARLLADDQSLRMKEIAAAIAAPQLELDALTAKFTDTLNGLEPAIELISNLQTTNAAHDILESFSLASKNWVFPDTRIEEFLAPVHGALEALGQLDFEAFTTDSEYDLEGARQALTEAGLDAAESPQEAIEAVTAAVLSTGKRRRNASTVNVNTLLSLVSILLALLAWLFPQMPANHEGDSSSPNVRSRPVQRIDDARSYDLAPERAHLKRIRLVLRDVPVFRRAARRPGRAGVLHVGEVVHVIGKRRNWTHVRWMPRDSEVELEGWVFSRYLGRIVPQKPRKPGAETPLKNATTGPPQ